MTNSSVKNKPARRLNVGIALLAFGAAIVCTGAFFLVRLGYFRQMDVAEANISTRMLLYKSHLGPYHTIGTAISEVETWAKNNGIPCNQTFGEYLDDPRKVEESRLRSNGGCVLGPDANIESIEKQKPVEMLLGQLDSGKFLQINFAGSAAIGPWKIYPYAQGYFRDHKWAFPDIVYEFYTVHNADEMTTEYLFRIN